MSVSAGDTVRWVVGDTQSGSGDTALTVLVIPAIYIVLKGEKAQPL